MKMAKKQCIKCNFFLLVKEFKVNPRTGQLTKCCVKCLEKSGQQTKCKHKKQRPYWKDCCRSQICEHNKQGSKCKDCGRSQACGHNKIKSSCKVCGGGGICEHIKRRSQCRDCGGGGIFEHNRIKSQCKDCDPLGHLAGVVRHHIYTALKNDREIIL